MMGRGILFGVIALVAACGGLYDLKYEVAARESALARLDIALAEADEAIHVLRMEWAYLNQPQKLQALVENRLDLSPVTLDQIASLDSALGAKRVGGRLESVELMISPYRAPATDEKGVAQ